MEAINLVGGCKPMLNASFLHEAMLQMELVPLPEAHEEEGTLTSAAIGEARSTAGDTRRRTATSATVEEARPTVGDTFHQDSKGDRWSKL
ncbi:hypothetical protein SESBI_06061 [Sesbania bispinosa]|nr:hypothetical protein SESBI_06061 [Sesbania bispinosa]